MKQRKRQTSEKPSAPAATIAGAEGSKPLVLATGLALAGWIAFLIGMALWA